MRRSMMVVTLLFALLALPALASAATFGAEVFGAFNSYKMTDVNDAVQGTNLDQINHGFTGGLDARLWATPNWMFSAGWEPLFAETKDDATGDKLNVDGNSFQLNGAYYFPMSEKAKYGVGGGVGFYSLNGKVSSTSGSTDIKGSGVGGQFLGLAEWTVSPGFAITAGAGYRAANIDIDNSSTNATVDYSGFMGRAGLAFYLPTH